MKTEQLNAMNQLGAWLARRDFCQLNQHSMEVACGIRRADVLVLLGNALPITVACAAEAYRAGLCGKILISGGIGHSTQLLWKAVQNDPSYCDIQTEGRAEADIFYDLLVQEEGIDPSVILVENQSENCGDNAVKAVELLYRSKIPARSLLLIQDPTMQRRSSACFEKEAAQGTRIISYAPFIPVLKEDLTFLQPENTQLWEVTRYLELILGEIPRLRDDENGYGPMGKGFIPHVEIPGFILNAYDVAYRGPENLRGRIIQ